MVTLSKHHWFRIAIITWACFVGALTLHSYAKNFVPKTYGYVTTEYVCNDNKTSCTEVRKEETHTDKLPIWIEFFRGNWGISFSVFLGLAGTVFGAKALITKENYEEETLKLAEEKI